MTDDTPRPATPIWLRALMALVLLAAAAVIYKAVSLSQIHGGPVRLREPSGMVRLQREGEVTLAVPDEPLRAGDRILTEPGGAVFLDYAGGTRARITGDGFLRIPDEPIGHLILQRGALAIDTRERTDGPFAVTIPTGALQLAQARCTVFATGPENEIRVGTGTAVLQAAGERVELGPDTTVLLTADGLRRLPPPLVTVDCDGQVPDLSTYPPEAAVRWRAGRSAITGLGSIEVEAGTARMPERWGAIAIPVSLPDGRAAGSVSAYLRCNRYTTPEARWVLGVREHDGDVWLLATGEAEALAAERWTRIAGSLEAPLGLQHRGGDGALDPTQVQAVLIGAGHEALAFLLDDIRILPAIAPGS
ncbi:MAG: hypothetical protein ACOCYV_02890 [Planctomycetota bacterium]